MAIPEFILRKMIVPDSLKSQSSGFSFSILNSFAPAVITRFQIFVGDRQIPEVSISLSAVELPSVTSDLIQPANPIPLPVGKEIVIKVNDFPLAGIVRIKAMTKEVGEIEFSISDNIDKKKKTELKPTLLHLLKPTKKAKFTTNLAGNTSNMSPFLMGQFIEHLENCIYGGIWTNDGSQLREDTLDLIRQLNPPLIRYPGGNFASGYHWEDGIGPRWKRPSRHDAAWQAEESNQVGTDEFLAFCESINTEPLLVVNDGSGSPEEAARWVAYCNDPEHTEQGARRAKNGHPQPYRVRYWGIGNEVWGPWQIGNTSASEYSRRARRFISAMKAVDPEIIVVVVGNNPLTDSPDDPATLWNKIVLEELGDSIDYLSWHIYQPEKSGWKDAYDPLELFKSVCAAPIDMEAIIKRIEKQIQLYANNHNVLQAVDEWNLWLPPCEKNTSMHQVTYTMRDALYIASTLMVFARHCETVGMANLAQLVNVLPLIQTNENSAIATSIFYPFILFSQLQTGILVSQVESEVFSSQYMDLNMLAHTKVPFLDGIASINDTRDTISLLLVNRYPLERMNVLIDLGDSTQFHASQALEVHAKLPESSNSFSKPDEIKITDARIPTKKDRLWSVTLRPGSIYFIEFQK